MLGIRLIQIAAIYMVVGLGLGMAMGISSDIALSSVHAHILLLGWATMAIAGLIYRVLPDCTRSRLAMVHFWGHNVGLPVMMMGLALKAYAQKNAEPAIAAGSTLVLIALSLFAVNVLRRGLEPTSIR